MGRPRRNGCGHSSKQSRTQSPYWPDTREGSHEHGDWKLHERQLLIGDRLVTMPENVTTRGPDPAELARSFWVDGRDQLLGDRRMTDTAALAGFAARPLAAPGHMGVDYEE